MRPRVAVPEAAAGVLGHELMRCPSIRWAAGAVDPARGRALDLFGLDVGGVVRWKKSDA